jgi:glycosyltransferase involved in cell wall biosynthesis
MSQLTVVLAPAGYDVDPDVGSDPERPWRLIQGLSRRGIRVVAVARRVAHQADFTPSVTIHLLPGKVPTTAGGRLIDRLRLYLLARAVALNEMDRGSLLAVHHFGPCSHGTPSLIPGTVRPFVYGPMPARHPTADLYTPAEWLIHLGLRGQPPVKAWPSRTITPVLWPVARAMWRRTVARADAVTVEAHANVPPERPDAIVIPSGVDTSRFSPDQTVLAVPKRILAVGGLYRRKGFDILIRALATVASAVDGLHVVVAGAGPEQSSLEQLACALNVQDRISFLGPLPRASLPELYRSAIAVCHPARFDNNPTSVMEAMACGLPVLVSDGGALPEMAGAAGLVHPVGNHDALAAQLSTIVENPALQRQLGSAAREHALRVYSLSTMCDSYLDLYRRLSVAQTAGAGNAAG